MRIVLPVLGLSLLACSATSQEPETRPPVRWKQDSSDHTLSLRSGGEELWRFHADPAAPHWFFHPLALRGTPALTVDRPADHVHHHGLWFCWKYIDGVNYWEHAPGEDRPAGRTRYAMRTSEFLEGGSTELVLHVEYAPSDDAAPVLTEERTIAVSAPSEDGSYAIDWTGRFTVRAERVVLDRTPLPGEPGGKVYGGYAGLSLRLAQLEEREAVAIEGPQEFNDQSRLRTRSNGFDYSGVLAGDTVGIAVLSHPDNPNSPSPWYAIRSPVMTFFSPAVLCYGPLELERGERMTLRYRVVVHPGRWDAERLAAELRRFVKKSRDPENTRKSP